MVNIVIRLVCREGRGNGGKIPSLDQPPVLSWEFNPFDLPNPSHMALRSHWLLGPYIGMGNSLAPGLLWAWWGFLYPGSPNLGKRWESKSPGDTVTLIPKDARLLGAPPLPWVTVLLTCEIPGWLCIVGGLAGGKLRFPQEKTSLALSSAKLSSGQRYREA